MTKPDPEFWNRVTTARARLLALDYDGTLAPFQVDRMAAAPLPGVTELLDLIAADPATRLAVISGRPLAELDRLAPGFAPRAVMFGAHGWEYREPGGPVQCRTRDRGVEEVLRRAHRAAVELGRQVLTEKDIANRVETKAAGVAVHVRGLDPKAGKQWIDLVAPQWRALLPEARLLPFDGGIEVRLPGWDKGKALQQLMDAVGGPELTVYVGDDETDEDAFRALGARGVGVRVGRDQRETAAGYALPDCRAVRGFLEHWTRAVPPKPEAREGRG